MKYHILDNFDFLDDDNSYGEKFEYDQNGDIVKKQKWDIYMNYSEYHYLNHRLNFVTFINDIEKIITLYDYTKDTIIATERRKQSYILNKQSGFHEIQEVDELISIKKTIINSNGEPLIEIHDNFVNSFFSYQTKYEYENNMKKKITKTSSLGTVNTLFFYINKTLIHKHIETNTLYEQTKSNFYFFSHDNGNKLTIEHFKNYKEKIGSIKLIVIQKKIKLELVIKFTEEFFELNNFIINIADSITNQLSYILTYFNSITSFENIDFSKIVTYFGEYEFETNCIHKKLTNIEFLNEIKAFKELIIRDLSYQDREGSLTLVKTVIRDEETFGNPEVVFNKFICNDFGIRKNGIIRIVKQ